MLDALSLNRDEGVGRKDDEAVELDVPDFRGLVHRRASSEMIQGHDCGRLGREGRLPDGRCLARREAIEYRAVNREEDDVLGFVGRGQDGGHQEVGLLA